MPLHPALCAWEDAGGKMRGLMSEGIGRKRTGGVGVVGIVMTYHERTPYFASPSVKSERRSRQSSWQRKLVWRAREPCSASPMRERFDPSARVQAASHTCGRFAVQPSGKNPLQSNKQMELTTSGAHRHSMPPPRFRAWQVLPLWWECAWRDASRFCECVCF